MNAIFRTEVPVGQPFTAPAELTFGWQEQRKAFSVWYRSDDKREVLYMILGTGHELQSILRIRQTVIMPDGFHAFHLCEVAL